MHPGFCLNSQLTHSSEYSCFTPLPFLRRHAIVLTSVRWMSEAHSRRISLSAILHIRLLGEFNLVYGEQPVTTVNTARLQSLLAYLVLHRDAPQPRYHIAYQFWPDSTEPQARTNLRKLFHQLQQALPDAGRFLYADTHTLQWQPASLFSLDVADFENAIGQPASSMALRDAVTLYHGDLLPSCYDDWILTERERLRQTFVEATEGLIALLESERDYQAAIGHAQRLLQHDPLHEATYRHLMRLHASNGDRTAALRAYHSCATILQRELGVEPSPSTLEAHARLLSLEATPLPQPGVRTLAAAFTLVGRQSEWARLHAVWRSAIGGEPCLALISGEAGIGKTRLAEELVQWADRQGILTASACCYATEGALAFAPVTTWLRARPLPMLNSLWLSEVARLLPEVLITSPGIPPPVPLAEAWQRQRLFEALARAILGSQQPLLLLLDDLQWCDRDTLEWLRYLLRFDPHARLLILGSLRPEEVRADHPLATLLTDLRYSNQLIEIELGPLTEAETWALAVQAASRELDATLANHLFRETEGNPLFVVEMARMGLPTGEYPVATRSPDRLPPKVQAMIAARLAQLSPPARELASVAAVIGRAFRVGVLTKASDVSEDALVCGLDELWQRRIVREQGEDAYDFSHDKLREVAYTGLSSTRRRVLHRRVAEALETLYAADLDDASSQVAIHYDRAGLAGHAIHYYQRAAEVSQRVYATTEAITYQSRALELMPETDYAGRYALLSAREKAYDLAGKRDAQAYDLRVLKELSEILNDNGQRAEVYLREAQYAESTSYYEAAIVAAQAVIGLAQRNQDVNHEAAGYLQWGRALWQQGDYAAAHARLERALQLARTARLPNVEADILHNIACAISYQDDYTRARDYAVQACTLYRNNGNRQGELRALNVMGVASYSQGDYTDADAQFNQALRLSREIGDRRTESVIQRNLGDLARRQGDYARAQVYYEQSLRQCRESGDRRSESETLAFLGLLWHHLGNDAAACESSRQAVFIAQSVYARYEESMALTSLGHALTGLGQLSEAADAYRQALVLQRELGQSTLALESLAGLARVALAQDNPAQALAHVEEILLHLETSALDSAEEPFMVYLTCYRVLLAHQDPRAGEILNAAYTRLQECAGKIKDDELRGSYLEKVPEYRELVKAWGKQKR
jgi:predicted ATPase/DNA-binding SARP family transcriptional activator